MLLTRYPKERAMNDNDTALTIPDSLEAPKPYHQIPDEPDKWYDRFQRFCLLGPSRSLLQCYRVVMQARDTDTRLAGNNDPGVEPGNAEAARPKRGHVPQTWRKRASEFDWEARAKAWDARQNALKNQTSSEMLKLADKADRIALQFQLDVVAGQIRDADGKTVKVTDIYQRRMAAKDIQRWSRAVRAQFQGMPAEKRAYVQVKEIRVNDLVEENKGNGVANPHE